MLGSRDANGPVLELPQGGKGMLDRTPADSESRESAQLADLNSWI